MKQKMWTYLIISILALAALACTCTSALPEVGPTLNDSGNENGADAQPNAGGNEDNSAGGANNTGDDAPANSDDDEVGGSNGAANGDVELVEGFPVTDDASDMFNATLGNIVSVSYKTDLSVAEAAEFYRTEMENLGYNLEQDVFTSEGGILTYNDDGALLTVSIGLDPTSNKTVVTIGSLE